MKGVREMREGVEVAGATVAGEERIRDDAGIG